MKKQLNEEISRIKDMMKKLMNEGEPFNGAGEPMMTHNQYRDYSEPSEPDYDDYDRRDDENYNSKEVVEYALRDAGIKFKDFPIYYGDDTPSAGDIRKINLVIDGHIFINFEGESMIDISEYYSEEEKHFDLEDRHAVEDMIDYIKKLQKNEM